MHRIWLVVIALGYSSAAFAVSLGGLLGSATWGRPLEVRVPIQWGPDESPDRLCIRPEVFFGDTPQANHLLSYSLESVQGPSGTLVIRTRQALDEPFVSINLQVGCAALFQRRYVLLADLPSEFPAPRAGLALAPKPSPDASDTEAAALVLKSAPPPSESPSVSRARGATPQRSPDRVVAQSAAQAPGRVALDRQVIRDFQGPRLTLLPPDAVPAPDLEPSLRLSFELGMVSNPLEAERQQAAARWQVLRASLDDQVARSVELEELRQVQKAHSAEMAAMNLRHAEMQAQRFNNPLVWLLAVLAASAAGAAAWLWRRQSADAHRTPTPEVWWASPPEAQAGGTGSGQAAAPVPARPPHNRGPGVQSGSSLVAKVTWPSGHPMAKRADGASVLPAPSAPLAVVASAPAEQQPASDPPELNVSVAKASRALVVEQLRDIQQRVDFFEALGDDEQAIRLLRTHIGPGIESHPMVYMTLFHIFQRRGLKDDRDALREATGAVFPSLAAHLEALTTQPRGVDSHPVMRAAIVSYWRQPHVLELIEDFLSAQRVQAELVDLESCRELLLLYGVAQELINTAGPDMRTIPPDAVPVVPAVPRCDDVAGRARTVGALGTLTQQALGDSPDPLTTRIPHPEVSPPSNKGMGATQTQPGTGSGTLQGARGGDLDFL